MNEHDRAYVARAIYAGWANNKNVPPWSALPDHRREQWLWAADAALRAFASIQRQATFRVAATA